MDFNKATFQKKNYQPRKKKGCSEWNNIRHTQVRVLLLRTRCMTKIVFDLLAFFFYPIIFESTVAEIQSRPRRPPFRIKIDSEHS